MIRAVIFDLDGTLVEFGIDAPWQAYVEVRQRLYDAMLEDPELLRKANSSRLSLSWTIPTYCHRLLPMSSLTSEMHKAL